MLLVHSGQQATRRSKIIVSKHLKMDKVINLTFEHIGETIFETIETVDLLHLRLVSSTWKELIDNVLVKRFKERLVKMTKQTLSS